MTRKYLHIISYLILPGFFSCEEQTGWDIQSSASFPVADCIITNELKYQELRLYHSSGQLNAAPGGISGATIELSDGTNSYLFEENVQEPGNYISAVPFLATAGNSYRLTVTTGEFSDTAFAWMTGVTPLEPLQIVPRDSLYRYIFNGTGQPAMTEVYYDWSADTGYCRVYGSCTASGVYYKLDNLDISREFAPDKTGISFPGNTVIIRRKYSLSEGHQRFIRSLLLETEWRGGIFDVEQGNVPTNFSHGIRGWFAACTVVSDTTRFGDIR